MIVGNNKGEHKGSKQWKNQSALPYLTSYKFSNVRLPVGLLIRIYSLMEIISIKIILMWKLELDIVGYLYTVHA